MNRQEKQTMVESLKREFLQSQGSFIVGFQGMTVAQLQALRRTLKPSGGKMQVTKGRLMRLASEDVAGACDLSPYFKHQVAIIFADKQAPAVAKVLVDIARQNDKLIIIAACVEAKVLDRAGVQFVASLPSREVLLAQVAGVLQAPAAEFARLLNQLLVDFVLLLTAVIEKKQQTENS